MEDDGHRNQIVGIKEGAAHHVRFNGIIVTGAVSVGIEKIGIEKLDEAVMNLHHDANEIEADQMIVANHEIRFAISKMKKKCV